MLHTVKFQYHCLVTGLVIVVIRIEEVVIFAASGGCKVILSIVHFHQLFVIDLRQPCRDLLVSSGRSSTLVGMPPIIFSSSAAVFFLYVYMRGST